MSPAAESPPLISAIVTTHNRRDMVLETLESIFAQTWPHYEVIVVDDGSTDGTAELLAERYGDRIRLVRREARSNVAVARNAGAAVARGEYIGFLDSDDWWVPTTLTDLAAVLQAADERVAFVGGACQHTDATGRTVLSTTHPPERATYADFCVRILMPGSGSNHLIRRTAYEAVGGCDPTLTRSSDRDLWLRLLKRYEVRFTPRVTARIRSHGTQRVGVDTRVIHECRQRIDAAIEDPVLRRKAQAWTAFFMFQRTWRSERLRSIGFLLQSVLRYPFALHPSAPRLRPALSTLRG